MVDIENILSDLGTKGNLRHLVHAGHCGGSMLIGGQRMLNLSSNDYLGLASDTEFYADFLRNSGLGDYVMKTMSGESSGRECIPENFLFSASSSRLLTGNFSIYEAVENELCALYGTEAALVFGSGYHANSGILPAVTGPDDVILADKLVHASIIDGIRLSPAKTVRYRHQDLDQLESLLKRHHTACGKIFIVTESIFSMDGDVTDLARLAALKKEYGNVMLYVDEAHAVGVRGRTGLGVAQEQDCIPDIDFLIGTLGKALASAGGYVVCTKAVRDFLVNRMPGDNVLLFIVIVPPDGVGFVFGCQFSGAVVGGGSDCVCLLAFIRRGFRDGDLGHIGPVAVEDAACVGRGRHLQPTGIQHHRHPSFGQAAARMLVLCAGGHQACRQQGV